MRSRVAMAPLGAKWFVEPRQETIELRRSSPELRSYGARLLLADGCYKHQAPTGAASQCLMLFTTRTMKRILILALGLFTLIHYPEAPAPHIALANAQDYAGRVRAAGRPCFFT